MQTYNGHSSKVELSVFVRGERFSLSHVGPEYFILREEFRAMPETEAVLEIAIDESVERRNIFLCDGIRGQRVSYWSP